MSSIAKIDYMLRLSALVVTIAFAGLQIHANDFGLIDQEGRFHQLSRYSDKQAIVLFVQKNGDATSRQLLPMIADLQRRFSDKSVLVLAINLDPEVSRNEIIRELSLLGVKLPVLIDTAQVVGRTLGIERTGEAFLINPKTFDVVFRGSVSPVQPPASGPKDDNLMPSHLESALIEFLSSKEPIKPMEPYSDGVAIQWQNSAVIPKGEASYEEDIAPIFQRRCATCHVENGLAPWAMTSHRMLQGWSPMIREVLLTRRMPPGQIDMEIGEWADVHQITDDEIALLVHWIDSGAPMSGDQDPLAKPAVESPAWPLGTPDVIVDLPEVTIPATGILDFEYRKIELQLEADRWVHAVAYGVGAPSVLHSLLVYTLNQDATISSSADLVSNKNAEFISIYVPGKTVDALADNAGFLLRKGSNLSVKLRYMTSGRETIDNTSIGFYFRDTPPEFSAHSIVVAKDDFIIPAGESNLVVTSTSTPINSDFFVSSFAPQMHSRGKSTSISAISPGGNTIKLINVPNYNYNWQMNYNLKELASFPAGTYFFSETIYDNSYSNPFNIKPEIDVVTGQTSENEILSHYIRIMIEN
ncbi:MAG: redoxin domain-containing protein [Gammaproteobacteria bacterium]|nr:redoxin domain-containing protein [Gammaproteobacteria bacterium]